mmetsp:Transcript_28290/g.71560  ORF Transcript_28290/g.71560 Transcript_28290/m.71560 type:complete len:248 (-) Transcript_28290:24-767(-)
MLPEKPHDGHHQQQQGRDAAGCQVPHEAHVPRQGQGRAHKDTHQEHEEPAGGLVRPGGHLEDLPAHDEVARPAAEAIAHVDRARKDRDAGMEQVLTNVLVAPTPRVDARPRDHPDAYQGQKRASGQATELVQQADLRGVRCHREHPRANGCLAQADRGGQRAAMAEGASPPPKPHDRFLLGALGHATFAACAVGPCQVSRASARRLRIARHRLLAGDCFRHRGHLLLSTTVWEKRKGRCCEAKPTLS